MSAGSTLAKGTLAATAAATWFTAPPLLTRSVHRESGVESWLLTKATLLDDGGELLAVNIIEDVTASR